MKTRMNKERHWNEDRRRIQPRCRHPVHRRLSGAAAVDDLVRDSLAGSSIDTPAVPGRVKTLRALWEHDELPSRSSGFHVGVGYGELVHAVCPVDRDVGLAGGNRVEELLEHGGR